MPSQRNVSERSVMTARRRKQPRNSGDAVGKYASDAWSLAQRTASGLNEIRKLINIETKPCDAIVTATAVNTTGFLTCVSELAQGTDYTNRVGDSIKIQRIQCRLRLYQNTGATETTFRAVCFRDLDGYGTLPTTAQVFQTVGTVSAPLSPYNWLNKDRFSILYDELIALNSTGQQSEEIVFDLPHAGHVKYLGTTAAAASDGKGSIYWAFLSDEGTNTPTAALYSRILFTDD
jgi:hypothetical protein